MGARPSSRRRRFGSLAEKQRFIYETADLVASADYDGNLEEQVRSYLNDVGYEVDPSVERAVVDVIRGRLSGFGPLTPLMLDDEVRDIAVNAPDEIWTLRSDGWRREKDISFGSRDELIEIMTRLVAETGIGMSLTKSEPVIDARLKNGGPRICAAIPPATEEPQLTIRKYRAQHLTFVDLVKTKPPSLSVDMAALLFACVRARLNIIVSGGTGSGKTTLLAALLSLVPADQRLILIEDTPEITIETSSGERPNLVRLLSDRNDPRRDPDAMLRASLRMSPDRIVVGEVRGGEALTMLQAMNTGHEGSMSTIHANSTADVLSRIETLAMMSKIELPYAAIKGQIAAALDVLVHVARIPVTGQHVVSEIAEVLWNEAEQRPVVRPIFVRFSDSSFRALNKPSFYARLEPFLPKNMSTFLSLENKT